MYFWHLASFHSWTRIFLALSIEYQGECSLTLLAYFTKILTVSIMYYQFKIVFGCGTVIGFQGPKILFSVFFFLSSKINVL